MPNKIEKHYSDFVGLDTRSNKLLQNPKALRRGSKNFRYNFQDELQIANGFQHKDEAGGYAKHGLIEYKFKDVNTGESKTQILGVGDDGNLYKKVANYLKLSKSGGLVTSYSFYYDEVADDFRIDFNPSLGFVAVTTSTTLDQLKTAINALAIAGLTADVVDDDGASISSSKLAYLMDCVIDQTIEDGSFVTNSSWFWEMVYFGDVSGVPFPTTANLSGNQNYEGVSFINQNNSVYMTDGAFPMKYDGKTVYRAGMPEVKTFFSGATVTPNTTTGGTLGTGQYRYLFQLGFVDYNGFEILGKTVLTEYFSATTSGGQNATLLNLPSIFSVDEFKDFPVYSCMSNGAQDIPAIGGNISVDTGHNVLPGMVLRIPTSNSPLGAAGFSYINALVTATTATSITVNFGSATGLYPFNATATTLLISGQAINAGYCQDEYINKITDPNDADLFSPSIKFGAFIRVYRTKVGQTQFYKRFDVALSHFGQYTMVDIFGDSTLVESLDADTGAEIPRACKYLSVWQQQLVQAGRPVDTDIQNLLYPTTKTATFTNSWGTDSTEIFDYRYTESHLCDFQSIYWADPSYPEGFPQSGLFEDSLDTPFNDQVKGIAPNKDAFFVFKERSCGYFTGNLAEQQINKEVIEADIGCASHRSIVEVRGALVWLDGVNGFYSCVAGRLPQPIGFNISDEVKINPSKLDFSKAVATNLRLENLYFCSIQDKMFVYDYGETSSAGNIRNAWYLWERFDVSAILATANDELLINVDDRVWKLKITNTKYDISDHKSEIDFDIRTAWLNEGEPSVDKSYIGVWINSIQGDFDLDIQKYSNYLDSESSRETISFPAEGAKLTIKVQSRISTAKVSSVSIGMQQSVKNKLIRIQGWDLQYAPDYDRGEPKR